MSGSRIHRGLFLFVLVAAFVLAACGSSNPDGRYEDANKTVALELKDGKASMSVGPVRVDGDYKVDGDKVVIRPSEGDTSQTVTFSRNKDGSLDGPEGSQMPRLQKAK